MGDPNEANAPRAVMLSVGEIAARDGVSAPTVSNHVKRLVEKHGLRVERDALGRVKAVNVAEYDHLRGQFSDPSKSQAPDPRPATDRESYDAALTQKTQYEAERKRIELAQLKGELIPTSEVIHGYGAAAATIRDVLERIDDAADEMAVAVGKDGVRGAEMALKRLKLSIGESIADALIARARDLHAGIAETASVSA
jgi:DNA-binding transcriptional ArsR family regulator